MRGKNGLVSKLWFLRFLIQGPKIRVRWIKMQIFISADFFFICPVIHKYCQYGASNISSDEVKIVIAMAIFLMILSIN